VETAALLVGLLCVKEARGEGGVRGRVLLVGVFDAGVFVWGWGFGGCFAFCGEGGGLGSEGGLCWWRDLEDWVVVVHCEGEGEKRIAHTAKKGMVRFEMGVRGISRMGKSPTQCLYCTGPLF
jgi:hypothetical protein